MNSELNSSLIEQNPSSGPPSYGGVRLLALCAGVAVTLLAACVSTTRTAVIPPKVPGATFIGMDNCAECHQEKVTGFASATHARLRADGANATEMGCEACHGPGSIHKETGGAAHTIVNPGKSPETCFQCHLDKRAEFSLPSHHPVLEGKISCSDCHEPHHGQAVLAGGTSIMEDNETCFQCHTAQRGPFVFEHEASREGCLTCHKPHGSINARMLTERNQTLCLKCHFQQQTITGQLLIGGQDHASRVTRGSCWAAGCHEAVHGSQVNTSLRF